MKMGIANDISPKKKSTRKDISKDNSKVAGENFEININNVPKYTDDPFVFDHNEKQDDTPESEEAEKKEKGKEIEHKEYFGNNGEKKGNPMTKWVVFLIIILILLLLYQNYSFVSGIFSKDKSENAKEVSNESLYENDYTTETLNTTSESDVAQESATEEDTATTTTPTIDRASLNISVLNGNGISGSAKEVKTTIESAGFSVSHVGNALKFSYINTEIYYNIGKVTEAEDLKSVITNRIVGISENSSITGNYDMVVVVGAN